MIQLVDRTLVDHGVTINLMARHLVRLKMRTRQELRCKVDNAALIVRDGDTEAKVVGDYQRGGTGAAVVGP